MIDYSIYEKLDEILALLKGEKRQGWIDMNEICEYSCLSSSTIRRSIKKGVLKVSTSTGKLLFKISDVDRWLNG